MNTVADFWMPSIAVAWIAVPFGRCSFARRVVMDLGKVKSYKHKC